MSPGAGRKHADGIRRKRHQPLTLRLARGIDDRVGAASFTSKALGKVFPDHFSFLFGELALYCFVVLVLTGLYLTFFFQASPHEVVYHGRYAPLAGQHVSEAYNSALRLSFEVRAGLLFRQVHHWAALVFLACIIAHVSRIFFTGAFRKPRDLNWYVGVTLLLLAVANGFAGYSLLDDLLSGTGLRVAFGLAESIPVVGPDVAFFAFGGNYPGPNIIGRLFVLHVLILPAAIVGVLSLHLAMVWRQKHTQFRGPGRNEDNVVGTRLWPTYAVRSVSLFFAVGAVLVLLGGLVQINPIWLYGPYRPAAVTTAAQPDWYMGWMEGALRLMPSGDLHLFGYTVANPFFPGVLLPGLTFTGLYLWPVIERRLSRDRDAHNLLDRPRDRPRRTALGVAVFTFYAVLFVAGGNDVLAARTGTSVNAMTEVLRVLLFVVPSLVGLLTWKICRDLRAGDPPDVEASPMTTSGPTVDDPPVPEPAAVAGTVGAAASQAPGSGHSARHVRGLVVEGGALAVLGALAYVTGRVLGRNHPGGPG
jgi:ubiquinol-cytochrome c reductase cytochrome b subunit